MQKFLSRFKLAQQIAVIGMLGIAGVAAVGGIYLWGAARRSENDQIMARVAAAQVATYEVGHQLLLARRAEKDFLLRREERYLNVNADALDAASDQLKTLAGLARQPEDRDLIGRVSNGVAAYGRQFVELGNSLQTLGLQEDEGLQGALRTAVHQIEEKLKTQDQPRLNTLMLMMRRHEKDFLLREEPRFGEQMKQRADEFAAALAASGVAEAERAAIAGLMAAYQRDFSKVVEQTFAANEASRKMSATYAALEPELQTLEQKIALLYTAARQTAESVAAGTRALILAGICLVALAVAAFAWAVGRGISRPIVDMTGRMGQLAGGQLDIAILGAERRDEIGRMAKAVQVFKDNMVEARRLEAEQQAEQARKAERQAAIEGYIKAFDTAVATALNALGSASTEMNAAAQSMTATAEETTRQATAVAAASDQASTNVQTVASASEELAASIGEIGRQVASSSAIAGKAVEEATRTDATVQSLASGAQKIGEVVKLINDIAGQTNLLALNATIEAARAGEAGKGFAVVASEVKSLATQTARATEEIGSQIAAIQAATEEAVAAIRRIGGTIGEMNQITTAIAAAIEEQGAATQEITRNVQQAAAGTAEVSCNIAGVTQAAGETGAAASQVLGTAGALAQQSESLRREVDTFLHNIRVA